MSEAEIAIEKFKAPVLILTEKLIKEANGEITCRINSEVAYDEAGLLLGNLRAGRKKWLDWLKKDPNKAPSECQGLEAVYFFAYQNLERAKKIVNDGVAWFEPREQAVATAIRDYDTRKQEELRRKLQEEERKQREAEIAAERARQAEEANRLEALRKEQEAERARLAAERAKSEDERKKLQEVARKAEEERRKAEAEQARERMKREEQEEAQRRSEERRQQQAEKAEQIAKGPEGTVKVTTFVPSVMDKAAFVKWVVRTENWHLIEVAEGALKKHVNANMGRNLPDGVGAKREDIIRRKSS